MSVVVIGVNHRTSPLRVLERVAVNGEAMPKALHALSSKNNIREAVVLSTCNRTEVYAVTEKFHAAYDDIAEFFCELGGLMSDELHQHLYSQHDDAAVAHLFSVSAGLESAVLGESEILGQVRSAWETAQTEGGAADGWRRNVGDQRIARRAAQALAGAVDEPHSHHHAAALRDGEQSPGAAMSHEEKMQIAELLDEMGVDVID